MQDGAVLRTEAGIRLTLGPSMLLGRQAMLHGCTIGEDSFNGIQSVILNDKDRKFSGTSGVSPRPASGVRPNFMPAPRFCAGHPRESVQSRRLITA